MPQWPHARPLASFAFWRRSTSLVAARLHDRFSELFGFVLSRRRLVLVGAARIAVVRTNPLKKFVADIRIILRDLEDRGVLLERQALLGDRLRCGLLGLRGCALHLLLEILLQFCHALQR